MSPATGGTVKDEDNVLLDADLKPAVHVLSLKGRFFTCLFTSGDPLDLNASHHSGCCSKVFSSFLKTHAADPGRDSPPAPHLGSQPGGKATARGLQVAVGHHRGRQPWGVACPPHEGGRPPRPLGSLPANFHLTKISGVLSGMSPLQGH